MEWTEEKEQLYEQFHNRFSIEKIKSMSLNEYNNTERKDSFCYWIETKLRCLGSIQGATSYKFGIYKYNDSPREDIGYNHDDNYAWLSKYGNTAEEVYKVVHFNILKIAEAAQKGDFDSIEKIDISNMFKWKIAFLYSNQKFLNIFAEDGLRFLVKKYGMENFYKASFSEMYQFLIKLKKETNVFEFTSKLWNEWLNSDEYKSKNAKKIKFWSGGIKWGNNDKFQEFSKNDFWQIGWDETSDTKGAKQAWNNIKKIQIGDYFSFHGYGGKNDLTIYQISKVMDKDVENGKLFIEKLNKEEDVLFHDKAPKMDKGGWFGTLFEVTGKEAINSIFGKYIQGDNEMQNEFENQLNKYKTLLENNRNLILHGAPGTGKTHLAKEIAKAMECEDDNIGFVQFHPSYDYTDFVEGLRPVERANGEIGFERKDGVFKKFCEKAILSSSDTENIWKELNDTPTVWKVSLEGTGDNPTRTDCMKNGYIRLGWHIYGDVADFSNFSGYTEEGGSVVLVAFQSKMKIGDIVLSCYSSTEIDAIGIVTGDYEYRPEGGNYPRYRTVKWIVKGIKENIVEKNNGKSLTLASVYKLSISIQDVFDIVRKYSNVSVKSSTDKMIQKFINDMNGKEIPSVRGKTSFPIVIKNNNIYIKAKSGNENIVNLLIIQQALNGIEPDEKHTYEAAIGNYIKKYYIKENSEGSLNKKLYVFIIDEINRGELSKIFGELFYAIDPGYRGIKGKINTQYQNLIKENNIFHTGFYIPENVYIIGTMNDIDRSVESMDFAMRRRFVFKEVTAEESAVNMKLSQDAVDRMARINNIIHETEGLGDAYKIGGSYFLNVSDFEQLWELKLSSLIKEYLRGIDDDNETNFKRIENAYFNKESSSDNEDENSPSVEN